MKKSNIRLLVIAPLTAGLIVACAQDKNRKDTFTRVIPGTVLNVNKPTNQDPNAPVVPARPQATPESLDTTQPAKTPPAADPTAKPEPKKEVTTAECRITNSDQLNEDQEKQTPCLGVYVEIDTDRNIKPLTQFVSLSNTIDPIELKKGSEKVFDGGKSIRIELETKDAKPKDGEKYELHLTYKLPEKASEIDTDKLMTVSLNDGEVVPTSKFDVLTPEGSDEVFVRINDVTIFEKIDFKIAVEYKLK